MSVLAEVLRKSWIADGHAKNTARPVGSSAIPLPTLSRDDEQIRLLVQQLFFGPAKLGIQHVAFADADPESHSSQLCRAVAEMIAEGEGPDVGFIDASLKNSALEPRVEHLVAGQYSGQEAKAGLRIVPREEWLTDEAITSASLTRLHELMMEFDFSIVRCGPMSPLAARIARACDGLVLLLTANRTRRAVAAQIKEQLRTAGVPLLGTVLSGRRFPIPTRLYRNL